MLSAANFQLFEKYKDAKDHAFSNDIVSEVDKDIYQATFTDLRNAAEQAIAKDQFAGLFRVWSARFSRDGGMQGQRPVDLWASVINEEADVFGRYPQVYVIASEHGLEVGFTVAIHEKDYYNAEVKQRNRTIVPILYQKLPEPNSEFVQNMDIALSNDGFWKFGIKSRQGGEGNFKSLAELIAFLKGPESSIQGGGSIYRIIVPEEVASSTFDLQNIIAQTLTRFAPLMRD
jgi:hypothetical protein